MNEANMLTIFNKVLYLTQNRKLAWSLSDSRGVRHFSVSLSRSSLQLLDQLEDGERVTELRFININGEIIAIAIWSDPSTKCHDYLYELAVGSNESDHIRVITHDVSPLVDLVKEYVFKYDMTAQSMMDDLDIISNED